MALLKPKTIVITQVSSGNRGVNGMWGTDSLAKLKPQPCQPAKVQIVRARPICIAEAPVGSPQSVMCDYNVHDMLLSDDDSSETSVVGMDSTDIPRKRKRLTYLSADEKMIRRKLKNRVAAQTARDRKKQRMTELEEELERLQAINRNLHRENLNLKHFSGTLSKENKELKHKFELVAKSSSHADDVITQKLPVAPPESAVLGTLQQWERARAAFQLMTHFLAFLWMFSLTCSSVSCSSSKEMKQSSLSKDNSSCPKEQAQNSEQPRRALATIQPPTMPWWGPQQRSWNPSMNS